MPTITMFLLRVMEWCYRPSDVTRLHPYRKPQKYWKDTTLLHTETANLLWLSFTLEFGNMDGSCYYGPNGETSAYTRPSRGSGLLCLLDLFPQLLISDQTSYLNQSLEISTVSLSYSQKRKLLY